MSAYRALEARFAELGDLQGATAILGWDQQVMMPTGANAARGEQLATLERLAHERLIVPEVGGWLEDAQGEDLGDWEAANLREMRREHTRATALPSDLIAALTRVATRTEMCWREARARSDFSRLAPDLAELFRLVRDKAAVLGEALDLEPYDALQDGFEPGLRASTVDRLLEPLAARLPDLLERVLERQAEVGRKPLGLRADPDRQEALGRELMADFGFDFDCGRLDRSVHPFCGGHAGDIRITARYAEADPFSGLMAVLHETGHALYELGLPKAFERQPVGRSRGMAVHESQSLLIEMQVCRSQPFLAHLAPRLGTVVTGAAPDPDALYAEAIHVERGLIRVDADEVTYPLHVILRYRLERALIAGDLEIGDLPGAWADGMRDLLGVVPPDDATGCLQDIHWPAGAIGYFPSYTLGALLAAQLFEAARQDEPLIEPGIARGNLSPLLVWLRTHVHGHGSRFDTEELVLRATGRPLSPEPFLDHLERRYLS